ncbi:MAG: pentapeptide repeat-containing protein [Myxococcota bacterium]
MTTRTVRWSPFAMLAMLSPALIQSADCGATRGLALTSLEVVAAGSDRIIAFQSSDRSYVAGTTLGVTSITVRAEAESAESEISYELAEGGAVLASGILGTGNGVVDLSIPEDTPLALEVVVSGAANTGIRSFRTYTVEINVGCGSTPCDDGNACSVDSCNAANTCEFSAQADGTRCTVGAPGDGVCVAGVCDSAGFVCDPTTCGNPLCDGATFSPTSCGLGACAAAGQQRCDNGILIDTCQPGVPIGSVDATCDDVDDDCDGVADDDYASTPITCGLGACARDGAIDCVAGVEQSVCTPGAPAALDGVCDMVDEDCDGLVDEDYASVATACGLGACAAIGETSCVLGSEVDSCSPGSPLSGSDATCDGIDDDCDGAADEEFMSGATVSCGIGACAVTSPETCEGGVVDRSCTPRSPTSSNDSSCNGVDDDCDGQTDEDGLCSGLAFPLGDCSGPSFIGRNLDGTDFSGRRDLDCADFTGASLEGADFAGASLERADFTQSALRSARFVDANIRHAVFDEADLSKANLANADARAASFARADLSYAETFGVELDGADLTEADLTGCR